MGTTSDESNPLRLRATPWELLRRACGDRVAIAQKFRRLGYALRNLIGRRERLARLERARTLGYIEKTPTRVQLVVGSIDMFRFFIIPAADDYYKSQGFSFGFHTLLRVLDDPASMIDATGLASHPDAIIGHLMQVVHANPIYDLQLLRCVAPDDSGLDELERQIQSMLDGTHARAESIGAIVEDPTYHRRLGEYTRSFRVHGERTPPMLRPNIDSKQKFKVADQTFGTLPAALAYFGTLPRRPGVGVAHIIRQRTLEPSSHA